MGEGKDRAREEKDRPWPLYKEGEYHASSAWPFGTCLKSRSHTSKHDWVTQTRIDENPVIRGTRSLLRQDEPIKPPRNTCRGRLGKTVRNDRTMAGCHVMKSCQQIRFVEYYTLYSGMCNLFYRARHNPCVQNLLWSIWRRKPPCNAEDNLRARLIVIEAWFRGYRGSPGLEGPRTAGLYTFGRTVGL